MADRVVTVPTKEQVVRVAQEGHRSRWFLQQVLELQYLRLWDWAVLVEQEVVLPAQMEATRRSVHLHLHLVAVWVRATTAAPSALRWAHRVPVARRPLRSVT